MKKIALIIALAFCMISGSANAATLTNAQIQQINDILRQTQEDVRYFSQYAVSGQVGTHSDQAALYASKLVTDTQNLYNALYAISPISTIALGECLYITNQWTILSKSFATTNPPHPVYPVHYIEQLNNLAQAYLGLGTIMLNVSPLASTFVGAAYNNAQALSSVTLSYSY